jgi:hypothetical protein
MKPICINCKKNIVNKDTASYSLEINAYFCCLDCLTNYAHEYLMCEPLKEEP